MGFESLPRSLTKPPETGLLVCGGGALCLASASGVLYASVGSWAQYTGLSCLGCPSQIRVANIDGSGVRTVTNPSDGSWDLSPTWSPDGTLFSTNGSSVFSGSENVMLYPFRLVTSIARSPDQTHFLVTARTVRADGPLDVCTIDANGTTGVARVTRNYNATSATWR